MPEWPQPPRHAKWSVAAQTNEAWGLAAGLMLTGSLILLVVEWSHDGFRSPRADWRLDACESPATAIARVEAIERIVGPDGKPIDRVRVRYSFDDGGARRNGMTWMPRGELREGDFRGVEILPDDREVHRLRGGANAHLAQWLPTFAGRVLLPLCLGLGAWLALVYRTLVTIRNGAAAEAKVVEARVPEPARSPRARFATRCLVRVRWTGGDGVERELTQRPRRGSPLGEALVGAEPGKPLATAFVAHDGRGARGACLVACSEAPRVTT